MTNARGIERIITDLEGALNALWNFAHSDELTIETVVGLQWLANQCDSLVDELRRTWDAANPEKAEQEPKLEAVEK